MAVINIDDAYILNETGAQVDKVTGLYFKDESTSAAEKAFAQLNIGTAGSNRNLLDNPWFTINQRGVAVGTNINANGFVADRWQATGTIGATRNSDGSLTINDTLFHKLPTDLELAGKTVTLSVLYADGTTEANTFQWSGTSTKYFTYGRAVVYASAYQINFNSFTKNVKAFKLELGSVSTLANDAPPNYVEELTKCKAYFERIKTANNATYGYFGTGVAYDTTHAIIIVPITPKIGDFSITSGGSFRLNNGGSITVTSLAFSGSRMTNTAGVLATASGLTAGSAYLLQANNDSTAYIDITSTIFD